MYGTLEEEALDVLWRGSRVTPPPHSPKRLALLVLKTLPEFPNNTEDPLCDSQEKSPDELNSPALRPWLTSNQGCFDSRSPTTSSCYFLSTIHRISSQPIP